MFNKTRIAWGFGIVFAIIIIALIDNYFLNLAVFALLLYLALGEAKRLFECDKPNILYAFLALFLGCVTKEPLACGILLLLLVLGELVYKKAPTLKNALPYLYPALPIFALWQLYLNEGIFALFWLIAIVALCDSGAYFIGKLIGFTPFSPTSPNKTREGVIGGLLCGGLLGTLIGLAGYPFLLSLVVSFAASLFAIIGDLLESYFKRQAGVKDSGTLIPGHGGILDRIDALMLAVFVMLALL